MAEPAAAGAAGRARLDDDAVWEGLAVLDGLLGQLEQAPGPTAQLALDAVAALLDVYGEALTRVSEAVAAASEVRAVLTADELLAHLFVLHDAHPDPVEHRVRQALDTLRPGLAGVGARAELRGLDATAARVVVHLDGQGTPPAAVTDAVREAVLALAPELSEVRVDVAAPQALIPVEALLRGPAAVGPAG